MLIVDVQGNLKEIKLPDPLLQVAVLTSSGRIDKAQEIAQRHDILHTPIAKLFAEYGHAQEAVALVRLDEKTKLEIALKFDVSIPLDATKAAHINTIITHCKSPEVRRKIGEAIGEQRINNLLS